MDSQNKYGGFMFGKCCLVLQALLLLCLCVSNLANAQGVREFVLQFRATPKAEGSLIRFGDLLDIRGDEEVAKRIADLPLLPAPQVGTELRVTKEEILQQLQIRGYELGQFRWFGEAETKFRAAAPEAPIGFRNTANLLPAYVTDRSAIQAERNVKDVVSRYIALQNPNLSGAKMQFEVPKEHLHLLLQRRNIKRIGGGETPWTGEQNFIIQLQDRNDLLEIPIKAFITPPETFVVAVKPLRRGDVIEATDLELQVVPTFSDPTQEIVYFTDFKDVIGKQLRRSISTGQPIRDSDVGPPIVIEKNQLVQIKVVMGGVEVETAGRAITEGAVGDLVQVETINLKERKKLNAQVLDSNSVQVIATGMSTARR